MAKSMGGIWVKILNRDRVLIWREGGLEFHAERCELSPAGGRHSFSDQEAEPLSFHPLERSPRWWSWQEPAPGRFATFGGSDRRSWKRSPAVIGSL